MFHNLFNSVNGLAIAVQLIPNKPFQVNFLLVAAYHRHVRTAAFQLNYITSFIPWGEFCKNQKVSP